MFLVDIQTASMYFYNIIFDVCNVYLNWQYMGNQNPVSVKGDLVLARLIHCLENPLKRRTAVHQMYIC